MEQENNQVVKVVSNEQKKRNLESTLYAFNRKYPFFAAFLSEVSIEHTTSIPTAGLVYDKNKNEFKTLINPVFFDELTPEHRLGVLFHEVLHFTHGHLIRMELMNQNFDSLTAEEKSKLMSEREVKNIAADMAINCFIPDLPDFVIRAEKFKDDNGVEFPKFLTYEQYLELLNKHKDNEHNKNKFTEYKVLDEHMWESLSEEEKARMLNKTKEVLDRTLKKTSDQYSNNKEFVKGLLETVEAEVAKLNYKNLLKMAIKKTVYKFNREGTWTRLNRRYGAFAPGTKVAKNPMLNIYVDTSGSISHTEINQFVKVIKGFLKAGAENANLYFWHTSLYHSEKIKLNTDFFSIETQSGGTDITEVIEHINKNQPDLAIVLTDGCFDKAAKLKKKNVIWVISSDYSSEHPYKDVGKTIKLSNVI